MQKRSETMTLINRNRHNDSGSILRLWIMSAAVCLIAIFVLIQLGPTVQRYLATIV